MIISIERAILLPLIIYIIDLGYIIFNSEFFIPEEDLHAVPL